MTIKPIPTKILSSAIRIFCWGLIYYLVNWFSLTYFLTPKGVAIAWPPVGIFISSIFLSNPKERPYLVAFLFIADFAADIHTGVSYGAKLVYAFLSTGDALISARILLRFVASPFALTKARNLLLYLLFSVILCNGFFSVIVSAVNSYVQGSEFFTGFLYTWVADSVGNLMIVPLLISWATFSLKDVKAMKFNHLIEIILLISSLISLNILLFPFFNNSLLFSFVINYLSFPFIIWAIFRFDMKIVTLVLLLLALVMLFNLTRENGIFTQSPEHYGYTFFQLYIASISIVSILITSIISERNQAHTALVESESKYRTVADYTYTWEYWLDPAGVIRYMSPSVERITGFTVAYFKANSKRLDQIVFPDDLPVWENHKKQMHMAGNTDKQIEIEFRITSKDGNIHWIAHNCRLIYNNGESLGIRVSNRDITMLVEAERKLLFNTVEIEERERSRYSRELHDGLGPLLSTIKMYIQSLSEVHDPERIRLIAEKSNDSIKIAIQTMREVVHGLCPFILSNLGYVNAIIDFIDGINKMQELTIKFNYNCKDRFSDFYEIILYRITTELINNTLKHAHASEAEVNFTYLRKKRAIKLAYVDNGIGFNPASFEGTRKGMGLINIQQRIKILGGNYRIISSKGKGTQIFIDFELNDINSKIESLTLSTH